MSLNQDNLHPQLREMLDEQTRRWQKGERPLIEDYQAQLDQIPDRMQGLAYLIFNDYECRWQRGESLTLEEYQKRFPELREQLTFQFELRKFAEKALGDGGELPAGYVLGRELGRGGSGIVYEAWESRLGRRVALKRLLPGFELVAEMRERFLREARVLAGLNHPHIIQVYRVSEEDQPLFIAMELVDGVSLAESLAAKRRSPDEAATLIETLARAVHVAHQNKLVHRDLKPGNIFLTREEVAKIGDFGLVKQLDTDIELTRTSCRQVGTPAYMAPEQVRSLKSVDFAADLYALGVIFYELLTGTVPFPPKQGESPQEFFERIKNQEPDEPSKRNPHVPQDLDTLCLRCLEKDAQKRKEHIPTAERLAWHLEQYRKGLPCLLRPVSRTERLLKWCQQNPFRAAVYALVGLVLLLLLVGGGLALKLSFDAETARADANTSRVERAEAEKRLLRENLERVEDAMADNLLRPIGYEEAGLSEGELGAMWDLAESTSERVRMRFIEKALETPEKALRLEVRGEVAVHAVVGLDLDRRERLLQLLLAKLCDEQTELPVRGVCVRLGLALQANDEAFAREGAKVLLTAMAQMTHSMAQSRLVTDLRRLAASLGPVERGKVAATAAHRIFDLIVEAVAEDPEGKLDNGSITPIRPRNVDWLTDALETLQPLLEPKEAVAIGDRAVELMTKTTREHVKILLAMVIGALAQKAGAADGHRIAVAAAEIIFSCLDKTPPGYSSTSRDTYDPSLALEALAPHLEPFEVSRIAHKALGSMPESLDGYIHSRLVNAAVVLASRCVQRDAARLTDKVLDRMVDAKYWQTVYPLADIIGVVRQQLPKSQVSELADKALKRMAETSSSQVLYLLARIVAASPAGGKPDPSTRAVGSAACRALDLLEQKDVNSPVLLAGAAKALALRMDREEASATAAKALQLMNRIKDPATQFGLAALVGSLVPRVQGAEAQRMAAVAANRLLDLMARGDRTETDGLFGMPVEINRSPDLQFTESTDPMKSLAASLGAQEAAKIAMRALVLAAKDEENGAPGLVRAVTSLAANLDARDAADALRQALNLMAKLQKRAIPDGKQVGIGPVVDPMATSARWSVPLLANTIKRTTFSCLAEAVAALARRLDPAEGSKLATAAALQLLDAMANTPMGGLYEDPLFSAIGIKMLAPSLLPTDAAVATQKALDLMIHGKGEARGAPLARAVWALATCLEPGEASTAARKALALTSSDLSWIRFSTSGEEAWKELAPNLQSDVAAEITIWVLDGMSGQIFAEGLGALAERLDEQGLVDLLKHPACVGDLRVAVLRVLAVRLNRPFADHWELARWVRETQRGLDLSQLHRPKAAARFKDSHDGPWLPLRLHGEHPLLEHPSGARSGPDRQFNSHRLNSDRRNRMPGKSEMTRERDK